MLPGSPALGAGDASGCLPADQRGVARSPAHCDIGAFESQGFTLTFVSGDNQKAKIGASFATPLAVAVGSHDWIGQVEPVEGGAIIFQSPSVPAAGLSAAPVVTATVVGAQAALAAVANLIPGTYVVTGTAHSESMPVFFHLENLLSPFDAPAQISLPMLGK
ncbi:MAG: hypothetical protein IPK16_11725 [Anaerolineales bacterium]|nr:hypothetical protein [Anaerolineales bacterium]